ncbi:hypothetical protein IQ266_17295 [filamentous cyanobacterium LEGE 11480]|uniref:Uncharacterized protein n=1 Tax=Romeriopsis navalis LEGE 11480 TaxID=2777977 RepID=A0A928VMX2_9CYAN|nr:hypothetical protein [Romeriopsis navalis]MBE9031491.1 hypothetical protein [Romeriopsis navalis LEGE 11480]
MKYFSTLQRIQSELEEIVFLEVKKNHLKAGPGSKEIRNFLANLDIEAPDEVIEFYGEVHSFSIEWRAMKNSMAKYLKNEELIAGRINILGLEQSLFGINKVKGWKDVIWYEDMESDDLELCQSIHPFDFYFPDQGEMACFQILKNEINEKIFLYGDESSLCSMNMGIREYLDLLLQTKGMLFWQQSLIFGGEKKKQLEYYMPLLNR